MKVSPYLSFNGNCTEAIALYQKAFNVQAMIMPDEETDNLIGHAQFELGSDTIMLHDMPGEPVQFGNNMMLTIQFDGDNNVETTWAKAAFVILKEGGKLITELEENDWNKCFGIVIDPFGIKWNFCGGFKN